MIQAGREWNVVVTVQEGHFKQARALLNAYGTVRKTDFYNVLVLRVDDIDRFLEAVRRDMDSGALARGMFGHISPVRQTFMFQHAAEFESKAAEFARGLAGQVAGKRFHVRMHRRGFKGRLSSQNEERFLDKVIVAALGEAPQVDFEDPDVVIVLETVGQRAGLALWGREQMALYPFLPID